MANGHEAKNGDLRTVNDENDKPSGLTIVSYMIAAAILIPLGWWLKENLGLADYLRSLFH